MRSVFNDSLTQFCRYLDSESRYQALKFGFEEINVSTGENSLTQSPTTPLPAHSHLPASMKKNDFNDRRNLENTSFKDAPDGKYLHHLNFASAAHAACRSLNNSERLFSENNLG